MMGPCPFDPTFDMDPTMVLDQNWVVVAPFEFSTGPFCRIFRGATLMFPKIEVDWVDILGLGQFGSNKRD